MFGAPSPTRGSECWRPMISTGRENVRSAVTARAVPANCAWTWLRSAALPAPRGAAGGRGTTPQEGGSPGSESFDVSTYDGVDAQPGQRASSGRTLSVNQRSRTHTRRARQRGGIRFDSGAYPSPLRPAWLFRAAPAAQRYVLWTTPRKGRGRRQAFESAADKPDCHGPRRVPPLPAIAPQSKDRAENQANVSSKVGAGPDTGDIAVAPGSSTSAGIGFDPPLPLPPPRCCWLTSA